MQLELNRLEVLAYNSEAAPEAGPILHMCERFFEAVLMHHNLAYFNPGEPEAYNENHRVPLTSVNAGNNGGMRTEEEEAREATGWELPSDLYWARVRLAQARDIIRELGD